MISRGKRYRKVFGILAKHGFDDIVGQLSGNRFLNVFKPKLTKEQQAQKLKDRWQRLRLVLEELGPTYIKFGQILSNRPGLLPDDLIAELTKLQDKVPPFTLEEVKATIEEAFGKPVAQIFADFTEKPLASASIAQVHKATLFTGEKVVIKVQRPGIEAIIRADIEILKDIANSAGISDQKNLGLSSIGGSRVIQHWNVPDANNQAKEALRTGQVDVLTLAPIFMPDDGIEKFAALALEQNPNIRITVQEIWLWRDTYEPIDQIWNPKAFDYNAITGAELRQRHAPLFKSIDNYVAELNRKFGKQVLFIVPAGQAVIALRERIIAGKAGGLKTQSELFTDRVGHPAKPLQVLVAYCHYAVIYRRSPVGLPTPEILAKDQKPEWGAETVRVLQEVAWEAVTQHPQSGVRDAGAAGSAQ